MVSEPYQRCSLRRSHPHSWNSGSSSWNWACSVDPRWSVRAETRWLTTCVMDGRGCAVFSPPTASSRIVSGDDELDRGVEETGRGGEMLRECRSGGSSVTSAGGVLDCVLGGLGPDVAAQEGFGRVWDSCCDCCCGRLVRRGLVPVGWGIVYGMADMGMGEIMGWG